MMRNKLSLRARFISALLVIMTLLAAGFAFSVFRLAIALELELGHRVVQHELAEFAAAFMKNPALSPASEPGMLGFIVRPGATPNLPSGLSAIEPSNSTRVRIEGIPYLAGRVDVGATRLYLAINNEHLEALEAQLLRLAAALLLAAFVIAVAAGFALSRMVTAPVANLARIVTTLDPSSRGVRLRGRFGDRDIERIAAAFDRYLERLDEFVGREQAFTDDASHELRTPLAVVMSAAQLLHEEPGLSPRGRERIERVQRATARMHATIEALLFLAREPRGAPTESCDLGEVLREALDTHRGAASEKGIALDADLRAPQVVAAPPGMVHIVIGNLLDNAIQHTDQGRVTVRLEPGQLVVQDTGEGISPADLANVFERGYRGTHSRGLGLGLYLVRRICDRLGWRIAVQSAPGSGTRFNISFPAD